MFKRLPCGCWFHWNEFEILDWDQHKYIMGNFKVFGWGWDGWKGNLTLLSPVLNTILNWRYRHMSLVIPGVTDADGQLLPDAPTCLIEPS